MNPPIVYEVASPSPHNTKRTTAIVHNMIHSFLVKPMPASRWS